MILLDYEQMTKFFHPALIKVLLDLDYEFGPKIATSLWRKKEGNESGIHETLPLRAVDFRCRNYYVGKAICEWINDRWEYDPDRPQKEVCIYHDTGYGWHLHIQVHDHTIFRGT